MFSLQYLPKIRTEIVAVLLSILIILLVYPILILFYFPCWIYKNLVAYFVFKNRKFGRIIDGVDAFLAGKTPYSNPMCCLLPCFYLGGTLDVPKLVKGLKQKIIEPGLYPELRQKIIQKYGYHFWYNVDNFKVEDHVRNLNPDCPNMPVTESELRHLTNRKLTRLPFHPERSPWEFIVVSNYMDERYPELKSVLMLRVNHCLMDGYSIDNLVMKLAEQPWKSLQVQKHEKPVLSNKLINLYSFVLLLFTGPYHFLKTYILCKDRNDFVRNVLRSDYNDIWNSQTTSNVSIDRLRSLRDFYGVSMSALITTLCSQAVFKTMKRSQTKNLSTTIHGILGYPMPGHKDQLTNHFTSVRIPIKVNEQDPVETLKFVQKELQSLQNSAKPLVFFYFSTMTALAPICLRYYPKTITPTTFLLSNFPGPCGMADILGCEWKQLHMAGKGLMGKAFVLVPVSVNGEYVFEVRSPVCNLPAQEDVDMLCSDLLQILSELENINVKAVEK